MGRARGFFTMSTVTAGVLVGGCLASCSGEWPGTSSMDSHSLWGQWQIRSVVLDGRSVAHSLEARPWSFRPSGACEAAPSKQRCGEGPLLAGHDGCNAFERSFQVDDDAGVLRWGTYFHSTAAACSGDVDVAMANIMASEEVAVTRTGDELVLAAGDGRIEFVLWG